MKRVPTASRALVDKVLSRMVKRGEIQRVARGYYAKLRKHRILGPIPPSMEEMTTAVERAIGATAVPSGNLALNLLGLSQQVPAQLTYKTPGPNRTLQFGNRKINLRHTESRQYRTGNRRVAVIIEALRTIGKAKIDERAMAHIRQSLTLADRRMLRRELHDAPVWMHQYLREIAR